MGIWGKILGSTAGLIIGGPLGALIGGLAGHAYDRLKTIHSTGDQEILERQGTFATAVIVLSAKMAKSDGRVTRDEINAFKKVFQIRWKKLVKI